VADAPLEAYGFYSLFAWTGQPTDQAVAWFLDGDHIAKASDFTASISWGDGTTSQGRLISQGYGMFDVAGTHTYSHAGNYTIQVTIKDVGGNSASATSPMSVDDATWVASPDLLSGTQGRAFTADVDTFLDGDPMATEGRRLTGAVGSPTSSVLLAIDPLGPTDSVRVLDEALASLGGATKLRSRWATL
jgi:hypothetical protein